MRSRQTAAAGIARPDERGVMLLGATAKHRNTEATLLHAIQRESFGYFLRETNPANGLVIDKTCVAFRPE
jgi:hypothetical protein